MEKTSRYEDNLGGQIKKGAADGKHWASKQVDNVKHQADKARGETSNKASDAKHKVEPKVDDAKSGVSGAVESVKDAVRASLQSCLRFVDARTLRSTSVKSLCPPACQKSNLPLACASTHAVIMQCVCSNQQCAATL